MSKNDVFRATRTILQDALTDMGEKNQLPLQPHVLYHYSSLEVLQKILESDDIRLSHAEYSNDQREIEEARSLIFVRLKAATPKPQKPLIRLDLAGSPFSVCPLMLQFRAVRYFGPILYEC